MIRESRMMMKYRKTCFAELKKLGYEDPVVYFDNLHKDKDYSSYWGDGVKRMEVTYELESSVLWVHELSFI